MFSVSTPGKVHLTSAHIVVYGKPALLAAVGLRTKATVFEKNHQGKIEFISENFSQKLLLSSDEVLKKYQSAQRTWQEFSRTKNLALLKQINSYPLDLMIYAFAQGLIYLKQKEIKDLSVQVSSQIPLGANLGSSAALSASLIAALCGHLEKNLDQEKINEQVYETEKLMHGFPSGGDNTCIVFGGLLWFRKEREFLKLFKTLNLNLENNFLLIDSGKPEEGTGEMVLKVKKLVNKRPKYTQKIFDKMEDLKKQFIQALWDKRVENLKELMTQDERNLEKLGAVSEKTKLLIRDLEKLGAGVGVSGGGGYKEGSGIIVAYCREKQAVKNYCQKINLPFYEVSLGVEGLKKEK